MNHLKIFEEFLNPGFKVIDIKYLTNFSRISQELAFNNKIYQILSFKANEYGIRTKKIPLENPTTIKLVSNFNDVLISSYFYLRLVSEKKPLIFCRVKKDQTELVLEMEYNDFVYVSRNPKKYVDKVTLLLLKLERGEYFSKVQNFE